MKHFKIRFACTLDIRHVAIADNIQQAMVQTCHYCDVHTLTIVNETIDMGPL